MKIGMIGCGYVADFYMQSLSYHKELQVAAAFDIDRARLEEFCNYYSVSPQFSLHDLLADDSLTLIINLTNPRAHFAVNKACIEAGKHVYTEKPLAMDYQSAKELVALARDKTVYLGSAPCSVFGETAQTMWSAIRSNLIGDVRLIYASFDAGMTTRMQPWNWRSPSGAKWPAKDEFEVGCTYEHAGYFLTWLCTFFGPARSVTSFATCLQKEKGIVVDRMAPDFTVGCIEFPADIIARTTVGMMAPPDRSMTIIGDEGVLYTKDIRDDSGFVYFMSARPGRLEKAVQWRADHWMSVLERHLNWMPWNWGRPWRLYQRIPFARKPHRRYSGAYKPVDFMRGPADFADAIAVGRAPKLAADFSLHITELTEALQYPDRFGGKKVLHSTFERIEPM